MLRTTGQQRTTGTRGVLRGPRGPKKYKGYRFQTSQFSTIVALLLKFQTFKSSEVKIGGYSKEKNFDLSFVTIVAGISKHSNHRRLKIDGSGKQKDFHLSSVMYCGFQMLLNHLVIKFSIMDPVILSDFNKTSQELRMLSSVTINCQVTKIVINLNCQYCNQCRKCHKSLPMIAPLVVCVFVFVFVIVFVFYEGGLIAAALALSLALLLSLYLSLKLSLYLSLSAF